MPTDEDCRTLQQEEGERDVLLMDTSHFKPRPGMLIRALPTLIVPCILLGVLYIGIASVFAGMVAQRWEPILFGIVLFIGVPYMLGELA